MPDMPAPITITSCSAAMLFSLPALMCRRATPRPPEHPSSTGQPSRSRDRLSKVGFWLNPSLGNVELIAADTNFAFSHLPETTLETANPVTAGHFVGISRPMADIGGFKI